MDVLGLSNISGRVRAHRVRDDVWTPQTAFKKNLIVYQWATIVAKLLATGDSKYRIGGLFMEFENVASPGDTVSAPAFDRTRDILYYDDLAGSSNRDYLRVPMTANQLTSVGTGLTNNDITFFARSSGTTGVHGKTFSDSVNSTVFGASLVAFIDNTDSTQDLILSSLYMDPADQQQKLASSQVGIEWAITLQ